MKTFSKAFGLAGLRLGYGIACKAIIENLRKVSQPFNINSMAIVAGMSSLLRLGHYHRIIQQTCQGRLYLEKKLQSLEIPFIPSQANFIMVYVKNAQEATQFLAKRGLFVRDLTSFGLREYIRVTISNHEHNRLFVEAMKEYILLKATNKGK